MERIAGDSLRPVSLFLGLVMLAFLAFNAVEFPPAVRLPILIHDAAIVVVYFALYLFGSRLSLARRMPHLFLAIETLLVQSNILFSFWLRHDPWFHTYLQLVLVAAGSVFLSRRWLVVVVVATLAGWLALGWGFVAPLVIAHHGFAIVAAAGVAFIIQGVRTGSLERRLVAEQSLRDGEDQLRHAQKLESLGHLAGGIAHDFNNLLVGVIANAEVARAAQDPRERDECLGDITDAAKRAAGLCHQMLVYAGRAERNAERVDLSRLVGDTSHHLATSLTRNARLRQELSPLLPATHADVGQLRQIVTHLLQNASDALVERPGIIAVRTGTTTVTEEELREARIGHDAPPGRYLTLEVEDDGCGIAPEAVPRIFDPFFTTKFTGRGLGLAATAGIVRGHRGAVFVESKVGLGSLFRVLLPAVAAEESRPSAEPLVRSPRPPGGMLLLVDDDPVVRRSVKRLLIQCAIPFLEASDGVEAIEVFRARGEEITLVLLDMTMPRLNGAETFEALRTLRADLPIILSTGYDAQSEQVGRDLMARGLAGFLPKPYTKDELLQAIDRAAA